MSLDTAFQLLTKRQPTDADVKALYKVKDALQIKDNDAIWTIVMALQYYASIYETMPDKIKATSAQSVEKVKAASEQILAEFRQTAQEEAMASLERSKAEMAKSLASVANKVARDTASGFRYRSIALAISAAFVTIAAVGIVTAVYSFDAGYNRGGIDAAGRKFKPR